MEMNVRCEMCDVWFVSYCNEICCENPDVMMPKFDWCDYCRFVGAPTSHCTWYLVVYVATVLRSFLLHKGILFGT
jgi:hypothetical protein